MNRLFFKVEVLIAVLVIGVLGIVALLAVSGARAQARDAIRLSDVRQMQVGVELYFNDQNEYPFHEEAIAAGTPSYRCLSVDGFGASCGAGDSVYQAIVAMPPMQGLSGASSCAGEEDGYCYLGAGSSYGINFELEKANSILQLQKGVNCAGPIGFLAGACSVLN